MKTEELLKEISTYNYASHGFPYIFLSYSFQYEYWEITWRNAYEFKNENQTQALTPQGSCLRALDFIKNNPKFFIKR